MNASRSPSATSAAKIAFKTMPAGPSLWINLKMDSIAESKRSLYSVLGSFLIGGVGGQVLPPRKLKFEPAAVRLRRKSSDLIHKCKICCTVQRQDARRRKPVPMLFQRRFGAPQKPGFANSPASVVAIEGFGLRNNCHVVR